MRVEVKEDGGEKVKGGGEREPTNNLGSIPVMCRRSVPVWHIGFRLREPLNFRSSPKTRSLHRARISSRGKTCQPDRRFVFQLLWPTPRPRSRRTPVALQSHGHSTKVAQAHYLQVRDEDFEKAVEKNRCNENTIPRRSSRWPKTEKSCNKSKTRKTKKS